MNIAVLSLVRDRLDYTRHCFERLHEWGAGCPFDHFVLDQGSQDGTLDWLLDWGWAEVASVRENVGISRGMNILLDELANPADYDVIVKFDNDCELATPNTLRDICTLVDEHQMILSPRIDGLNNPPATIRSLVVGDHLVDDIQQIGGIFLAAPASLYETYRFNEANPAWGVDDAEVCAYWRAQGGVCGYVRGYTANHYETTSGQHSRYPEYFARTLAEGKPSL